MEGETDHDTRIRASAFAHLRHLIARSPILDNKVIDLGFTFEDRRWPLWSPQRGIFKPSAMPFLLSIRTVIPRKGARVWYDDQRAAHEPIYAGAETLDSLRCEKTARNYCAFVALAAAFILIKSVHAA